jgi:hypothetical protein
MSRKVIINACYGRFSLSEKALKLYASRRKPDMPPMGQFGSIDQIGDRVNPILIDVIEELEEQANTENSSLKIVEIPDDVKWYIEDRDGWEHIAEVHKVWH